MSLLPPGQHADAAAPGVVVLGGEASSLKTSGPASRVSVSIPAPDRESGRKAALGMLSAHLTSTGGQAGVHVDIFAESWLDGRYLAFFQLTGGTSDTASLTSGDSDVDADDPAPWHIPKFALLILTRPDGGWGEKPGRPVTKPFTIVPTSGDTEDHRSVRPQDILALRSGEVTDGVAGLLVKYRTDTLLVVSEGHVLVLQGDELSDPLPLVEPTTENGVVSGAGAAAYSLFRNP